MPCLEACSKLAKHWLKKIMWTEVNMNKKLIWRSAYQKHAWQTEHMGSSLEEIPRILSKRYRSATDVMKSFTLYRFRVETQQHYDSQGSHPHFWFLEQWMTFQILSLFFSRATITMTASSKYWHTPIDICRDCTDTTGCAWRRVLRGTPCSTVGQCPGVAQGYYTHIKLLNFQLQLDKLLFIFCGSSLSIIKWFLYSTSEALLCRSTALQ